MTDTWLADSAIDNRPPDIVVHVGVRSFHSHKDVLMKYCDYFKAMFSSQMLEITQEEITIKLIDDPYPFEILICSFYSEKLQLTSENIFEVTLCAHILQVSEPLFKQCCDFLKNLVNRQNCFDIMHFTRFHNLQDVYNASRRFCLTHFLSLCKEDAFLNLEFDEVVSYLSDEFLVVDEEYETVQGFEKWCQVNGVFDVKLLQKALLRIIHVRDGSMQLCEDIAKKLSCQEKLDSNIESMLGCHMLNQDLMMFWARLSNSKGDGLVDVVKVDASSKDQKDVNAIKVDTMTTLVERPGFDLGSAVCGKGPYVYVSGGGPNFGRMDWIRDLWRYDVLEEENRWNAIGKLPQSWRYHAMVAVGTNLYIFGGFGKFRSKNTTLVSFDVVTGTWSEHAQMPTHEIKPVATCHQSNIFYIGRDWKVYAYSTILNQWTVLENKTELTNDVADCERRGTPVSCFMFPDSRFVALSQGTNFQTHSLRLDVKSESFHISSHQLHHDIDLKTSTYMGSCVLHGEVVIYFEELKAEEYDGNDSNNEEEKEAECMPIHVMSFVPTLNELRYWFQINNVQKSLAPVAVPRLAETFKIKSHSMNEGGMVQDS